MNFISLIFLSASRRLHQVKNHIGHIDGKSLLKHSAQVEINVQQTAAKVLDILKSAEKNDQCLEHELKNAVETYGWTGNIAVAILDALVKVLNPGAWMAQAMKDAFQKLVNEAQEFVIAHPIYTTIIALGILVTLAPWVIEALGFGALGPIEGTFAALWQARYAGYIPRRSLFSFFQRLGMVWK